MTTIMRYALQYIYEPEKISSENIRQMQYSIVSWGKYFELKSEMKWDKHLKQYIETGLSAVDQELQERLQEIGFLLHKNEKGELESRKKNFKYHGIDYKKFHNLPGAHKPEDLERARKEKAEYDKKFPEQEGLVWNRKD